MLGLTHFSVCSVWLVFSASPSILMSAIWLPSRLRTHGPTYGQNAKARKPDQHTSLIGEQVQHRVNNMMTTKACEL